MALAFKGALLSMHTAFSLVIVVISCRRRSHRGAAAWNVE
jgi:hypothetical protein